MNSELNLIPVSSTNHPFFRKDISQLNNEDIEIMVVEDTAVVIDHNKREGIMATGQPLVSNILLETVKNKSSLLNEEEIEEELNWINTIKPGIIKHNGKTYNVFTNRNGEQCYTDGDKIFKAPTSPTGQAIEISKENCLSNQANRSQAHMNNSGNILQNKISQKMMELNFQQEIENLKRSLQSQQEMSETPEDESSDLSGYADLLGYELPDTFEGLLDSEDNTKDEYLNLISDLSTNSTDWINDLFKDIIDK